MKHGQLLLSVVLQRVGTAQTSGAATAGQRRRRDRDSASAAPALHEMVSVMVASGAERERGNRKHQSSRAAGQERSAERRGTGQCDDGGTARKHERERDSLGLPYSLPKTACAIGLMGQKLKCCSWAIWATTRAMAPVALVPGPPTYIYKVLSGLKKIFFPRARFS